MTTMTTMATGTAGTPETPMPPLAPSKRAAHRSGRADLETTRPPLGALTRRCATVVPWMLLAMLSGCDQGGSEDATSAAPTEDPRTTRWSDGVEGPIVAIEDERLRQELAAATSEAKRSAPTARQRWLATPLDQRDRWAIKWAAPIRRGEGAGRAEHVWVEPLQWSGDRIEGTLLNAPRRAIGFWVGDLVTVPFDELGDWFESLGAPAAPALDVLLRTPVADPAPPPHSGGFTVLVLRRWFAPQLAQ